MTRLDLIKSDEYIMATIDCIVTSGKGVKQIKRELKEALLAHKKELIKLLNHR